jgi:hypothetical protein
MLGCALLRFIGDRAADRRMDKTSRYLALAAAVLIVAVLAIMIFGVWPLVAHLHG